MGHLVVLCPLDRAFPTERVDSELLASAVWSVRDWHRQARALAVRRGSEAFDSLVQVLRWLRREQPAVLGSLGPTLKNRPERIHWLTERLKRTCANGWEVAGLAIGWWVPGHAGEEEAAPVYDISAVVGCELLGPVSDLAVPLAHVGYHLGQRVLFAIQEEATKGGQVVRTGLRVPGWDPNRGEIEIDGGLFDAAQSIPGFINRTAPPVVEDDVLDQVFGGLEDRLLGELTAEVRFEIDFDAAGELPLHEFGRVMAAVGGSCGILLHGGSAVLTPQVLEPLENGCLVASAFVQPSELLAVREGTGGGISKRRGKLSRAHLSGLNLARAVRSASYEWIDADDTQTLCFDVAVG